MTASRYFPAADDADVVEASLFGTSVNDVPVLLVRLRGTVHAMGRICTHEDADLAEGTLDDGCVVCPLHGSRFDVVTGQALTLPAIFPEPTYDVKIQDGIIYVCVVSGDA